MANPVLKLKFDELTPGDEAPVVSHQLGRTDLVKYSGASGDFNPMHTDEVAAQAEELRVQRAAIARTQRALRSLNRPAEEQATEPALRDPS